MSRSNFELVTLFVVELKQTEENFVSVTLYFFNKIFTVIWYLKPFVSSKRLLEKPLMLVSLAYDWINGSFFSIDSTLHDIAYPLNAWSVFITLNSSLKKKFTKQCFLSV